MGTQLVDHVAARVPDAFNGSKDEQRRWFAVFTRSHHEKRVAQYYLERSIEHLLPIARVMRQWSHYRRVTLEMPLFPNYIFVHICHRERVPAALPDGEIELLRESLKVQNFAPHPYLVAGAKVRINKGPLAGKVGIVLRHGNGTRVVLTFALIMRSFAVEVDAADLDFIA